MNDPEKPGEADKRRKAPSAPDQQQTAEYIAQMSSGLMEMAADAGMLRLTTMLEKAAEEAVRQGGVRSRRRPGKRQ